MKKVIFLIEYEGNVLAFFPEEKYDNQGNMICFDGEFSRCPLFYAKDECKIATPDQYKEIKAILENEYKYELKVMKSW